MPPRHAYWTIILEGKPTAFRAHTQDELVPTFRQLQARHPDVVMKWFSRGRLWNSPEEQILAARMARQSERRGPGWRPGGAHRDPRERFKVPRDEKRQRFKERLTRDRRERAEGQRSEGQGSRGTRRPQTRGPQSRFRGPQSRGPRGRGRGGGGQGR